MPLLLMIETVTTYKNFITTSEEVTLLEEIAKLVPRGRSVNGERNAILRFGSDVPYLDHMVSGEIPHWLDQFRPRIAFDHVTINEYYRGQEIPWHIDSKGCGETISVLSLEADGVLKFRKGVTVEYCPTPRRALVEFSGPARWEWEHSLYATEKRYSIVFRNSRT